MAHVRRELRAPKSDVAVLLTTFGLTVLVDLTVAIVGRHGARRVFFIRRMATTSEINALTSSADDDALDPSMRRVIPPGVEVFEINGPLFFGAAELFKETLDIVAGRPRVLVIRMRGVSVLDSTGMHVLKDIVHRSRREGTRVLLVDLQAQPAAALNGSKLLEELGEANVLPDLDAALAVAETIAR